MPRFILLILLTSLFFFSCQNSGKEKSEYMLPVFKHQEVARVTLFKIDKPLASVFSVNVFGDYLFVGSPVDNFYIHIFNKHTGAFITSAASKGRGPGEFVNYVRSLDTVKDTIYVSEGSSDRPVYLYNLMDFVNKANNFRTIDISGCSRSYLGLFPVKEGFLSAPATKGDRFAIHDKSGKMVSIYHKFPDLGVELDTLHLWKMIQLRTGLAVKPDRNKFAAVTMLGAILEIYSIENNKIRLEKELKFYPPKIVINRSDSRSRIHPDCMIGFWNAVATNDFIYTIFSGKTERDFQSTPLLADFVYVFDWEGNPVKSYTVPCKIKRLSVNEQTKRAYITTVDEEGMDVVGYFDL